MGDSDSNSITNEIEDGSYYVSARKWYSELFHAPIADRSYYIIIILLASVNAYYAVNSFLSIFPIATRVPFVTYSNDVLEDLPRIKRITAFKGEDGNLAVMRFMLNNYVVNRESYDLNKYELRYRSVWSQSAPPVFDQYKTMMDTSNAYSPYRLYTNRAHSIVTLDSFAYEKLGDNSIAHIVFEISVRSSADEQELSHSKRRADITYKYTPFEVDQSLSKDVWVARLFGLTGNTLKVSGEKRKITPMTFIVSDYQVKELLE